METKPVFLIVEDDPDDQEFIEYAIEAVCAAGADVRMLSDGSELIEYLRDHESEPAVPRLVVLDLNLPHKDGRTALREMKADPKLAEIPVAVLTTSTREEDQQYCQGYGVEQYYSKPSSIGELEDIFAELCRRYIRSGDTGRR